MAIRFNPGRCCGCGPACVPICGAAPGAPLYLTDSTFGTIQLNPFKPAKYAGGGGGRCAYFGCATFEIEATSLVDAGHLDVWAAVVPLPAARYCEQPSDRYQLMYFMPSVLGITQTKEDTDCGRIAGERRNSTNCNQSEYGVNPRFAYDYGGTNARPLYGEMSSDLSPARWQAMLSREICCDADAEGDCACPLVFDGFFSVTVNYPAPSSSVNWPPSVRHNNPYFLRGGESCRDDSISVTFTLSV